MKNKKLTLLILVLASSAVCAVTGTTTKKKKKLTLLDLLNATTGQSHRSSSVAGVRGLEDTGTAGIDTRARDYAALDKLEHIGLHDADVSRFVEEGNLK